MQALEKYAYSLKALGKQDKVRTSILLDVGNTQAKAVTEHQATQPELHRIPQIIHWTTFWHW